jgi:hypothetical protein
MNTSDALPEENNYGIAIKASLRPQTSEKPLNILVQGELRVPYGINGVPDKGTTVLKHIVLVVTRSGNYQSLTPFKEVIVFEDDVREEPNGCYTSFNIKVFDHILFDGAGDYYVLCSIGTYTSNIVKIVVS